MQQAAAQVGGGGMRAARTVRQGTPHFVASFVGNFVEREKLSGWMKRAV
jgi:hypothetical protein